MDNQLLFGKRVLVIEDEMLVLMGIEDMLNNLGCTSVMLAGNVETALSIIAANNFDMATVDLNLNGVRSYVIPEALKRRRIPFAFSTGYNEHGVDEGYGDRPVLKKPYTGSQLELVISELLTGGARTVLA